MTMNYRGMRALVTGASSGIGEVFAAKLAERGSDLVLVARSEEKLDALASRLRVSTSAHIDVVRWDLAEPGAGARLAQTLSDRGVQVDILVNNAGVGAYGSFDVLDPEQVSSQLLLNVNALTELTQALLPGMLVRDRGAVINVASTAAFQPLPYMAVYGATKSYVLSFTEALWAETRGTQVRVTALCPGATDTAFFDVAGEDASVGKRMAPEPVVDSAFRALERRRSSIIPGRANRLLANMPRLTSRQTIARIAERTMRSSAKTTASASHTATP